MPKDYKNINKKKQDTTKSFRSVVPFMSGLTIGLFIALIVYLNEHQTTRKSDEVPELIVENMSDQDGDEDKNPEQTLPEPEYDFYQILPNMEVNVSEWVADEKGTPDPVTDNDGVYILQIGSFEEYESADKVKAKLALIGISADIQRVVINGRDVRHRVRVGPYKDIDKLTETRERLLANNLDFMLLKLDVDDI